MLLILLVLLPWLALPLIMEFDYRVFNRLITHHLTRKEYLLASMMESAMWSGGVLVGWAMK